MVFFILKKNQKPKEEKLKNKVKEFLNTNVYKVKYSGTM